MAVDDDEAAFRWDGDEPDPVEKAPRGAVAAESTNAPTSSFLLVSYGILAGAYLLFTIGWAIAVARSPSPAQTVLDEVMYQFGEFLAIAAAPLWFAAVFVLARGVRPAVRLILLLVGAIVLVPWPFLLGGAV
ncbi:hypothetical protein EYE40_00810 [Glaciihabitans arcticus]|uniref:DNA polymerase III subunit gamma/tau n=1 Tax=Glaciihabitans arcticus TaxID=2668039 RepID=A0A4Q9GU20_9MICO|nr:hypothetical protein [Glaciihabitans arcticus]TBN56053.1 hypothetical protein EYE40_00810 [Glaciihabitans arcticus]